MIRRYPQLVRRGQHPTRCPARHTGISRDPVLIYQMSKVGSTSLMYSLQFAYAKAGLLNVPLHHAHTLSNLDLHEEWAQGAPAQQLNLVRGYKQLRRNYEARPDEHWNVISLVRDPVARQVSDYFHHIDCHLPDWHRRWRANDLGIEEILESFLHVHDPTFNWFEAEIESLLGIDVYSSRFPHEAGYQIIRRPPKASLLILRLEDLDRVAGRAIEQLLGIKAFKLYSFNMGSESAYGEIYRHFKQRGLPPEYLEMIYSRRIAQHFYTRAERDQFAANWTEKSSQVACRQA
jgi:hypothetical protein